MIRFWGGVIELVAVGLLLLSGLVFANTATNGERMLIKVAAFILALVVACVIGYVGLTMLSGDCVVFCVE